MMEAPSILHTYIPSPDDSPPSQRLDPAHAAAIKRWTAEILKLDAEAVVTVSEMRCADAGCPLVETVIAVFESGKSRRWKLTRPRMAVSKVVVIQTLAADPELGG